VTRSIVNVQIKFRRMFTFSLCLDQTNAKRQMSVWLSAF